MKDKQRPGNARTFWRGHQAYERDVRFARFSPERQPLALAQRGERFTCSVNVSTEDETFTSSSLPFRLRRMTGRLRENLRWKTLVRNGAGDARAHATWCGHLPGAGLSGV